MTDPSGVTTTFGFDLADRLTSKAFSNGPTTTLAYDTCDEVQSIITKNGGGSVLVQNAYTYDPAGNVATRTDTDGTIASFGYNGGDQLTAESYYQGGVNSYITYSYDHNGNRTTQNVNNSTLTTYAYNSTDELTSDSTGGTYSYDNNGNWTKLVSGGSTYQFQYDAENRLTYYSSPSASSSYVSKGAGLRVTENDSGTSGEHDFLHDGSSPASGLLVDSNLTGSNLFHVYTPGIDQSDAGTGAVHLMAEDALGTVRGFINDNAAEAVTDTFGSFAFGAPRTRTGSDAFSLAWGGADGYQTDANGLVLMGNRVYHVYTGRFLTRDPAGAGDNDYEYADDSPLNEIDPSGLDPVLGMDDENYSFGGPPDFTDATGGEYWIFDNGSTLAGPTYSSPTLASLNPEGAYEDTPDDSSYFGSSGIEEEALPSTMALVGGADSLLLDGAGSHYASVSSAYISGRVGLGTLALASVGLVAGVALAIAPGGEEVNLEARGAEETARLAEGWAAGSFKTVEESFAYHFEKHGEEVGATNLLQYLRKADAFSQNLKRASTAALENGYRYTKAGRYIIKDFEGKILTFGAE